MTERPAIKLDYEQDVYIRQLVFSKREKLYSMDSKDKVFHILSESLVDENGCQIDKLTPKFIADNFTSEWVQAIYLDIIEHNRPKKKLNSQ